MRRADVADFQDPKNGVLERLDLGDGGQLMAISFAAVKPNAAIAELRLASNGTGRGNASLQRD